MGVSMVKANEKKVKRPRPVTRPGLLGLLLLSAVITACAGRSPHTINLMPAPAVSPMILIRDRSISTSPDIS
jgi:hypothetical protein